jgi:hypothetical protein
VGIRIIRKQFQHTELNIGADRVLGLMPIPPRGRFNSFRGEVHLLAHDVPKASACFYPVRAYACQMVEIEDLVNSQDALWDRFVPKDSDTSEVAGTYQLDLSRDSQDTAPFEEPGEASPNELFGVKEPSTLLYRRDTLSSMATSQAGYEGASADTYSLVEHYFPSSKRSVYFPQGGFVAIGIGCPVFDDVQSANPNAMADVKDVLMYTNLPDFLHTARLALIGATESSAETPFVDVLSLIEELVEPSVVEDSVNLWANRDINVFSRFIFDVTVAENSDTAVLKSD